ncbi:MAG: DpnII family type II restriction endonuclease [Limisphaerales bacterium]
MLESRKYPTPEAFVHAFLSTLTPGIIPRSNFIQWPTIMEKLEHLQPHVEFYGDLAARIAKGTDFVQELTDSLLAADDPLPLVQCAFELLGHTNSEFVTKEDDTTNVALAERYVRRDEKSSRYFAELLRDLGFERILRRNDLEDVLLGVQIGLETHRRKNIGGDAFHHEVAALLDQVARQLAGKGKALLVQPETTIRYGRGLSKKVDFALTQDGQVRFGVEVNFYTVQGSKPTEIKRSYGDITRGLHGVGVELLWITDGKGYRSMQRSLRDAFVTMPNIYNLRQAQQSLQNDLWLALK